jgi:trehalose 6-phosphate phosphatase
VSRILGNLPQLKKLIERQPFGLITDIDGTISPTSTDPLHVKIPAENLRYLSILVKKLALVAVISGREVAAIKEMVNIDGVQYIGHYGMEWWQNGKAVLHPEAHSYIPAIRAVAAELETLRSFQEIIIQDKWASISVHYRLSPQPEIAKQKILELLRNSANTKNLRIIEEKMVIGIVPPVNVDKGTAVTNLIEQNKLAGAIYLGDDTADVPGFHAIRKAKKSGNFDGLGILVVSEEINPGVIKEADFTLDGVKETTLLLKWMAEN